MRLTLQVLASALIVAGVLVFMWRLPRRGEWLYPWAPPLALGSAWLGLLALVLTALLWVLPAPDAWLVVLFLALDPAAIAAAVLVHWIYRGAAGSETIELQRLQAKVGLTLGVLAVALGYAYVMTHKTLFTPVGG